MREIRVRFSKTDRCKYISHLDLNRCMARALARARIPLWYTEGYNPHPYMSFSLPLSLGVESRCESMDIRIVGEMANDEIKRRLNDALPDGIRITDIYDDFRDSGEIAFSDYVFRLEFNDNASAFEKIKEALGSERITVEKKAKQGRCRVVKETDIKPLIDEYSLSIKDKGIVLNARLAAGNSKNLNPALLLDTLIKLTGLEYEWKNITRTALLDKNYKIFK